MTIADDKVRFEKMQGAGLNLNVARAGSGKPVVLLHGFPEFWYSWHKQIGPLAQNGFDVFAPDLRGYNLSDRPEGIENYHLKLLVEDVACIVRACGSKQAHIVAHDWGGVIAWAFAGKYPELVDRFVVMNAPHGKLYRREIRRPPQMFLSWYIFFFQLPWLPEWYMSSNNYAVMREIFTETPANKDAFPKEEIDKYVEAISRPGALNAGINYYRAMLQCKDGRTLGMNSHVSAETLVIWGEQDHALCSRLLDGIEDVAPRARVHRIPNAAHWVQNEAADEVNRVLLDFLLA